MTTPEDIYIVEDSPTQALTAKRALMHLDNVKIHIFSDGLEAYRAILEQPPHLLLMDLILPSLHGLALCRLLKFHADYQHIPVLLFSSITDSDVADRALQAGANVFLPKPYDPDTLLDRVQQLRARYPEPEGKS